MRWWPLTKRTGNPLTILRSGRFRVAIGVDLPHPHSHSPAPLPSPGVLDSIAQMMPDAPEGWVKWALLIICVPHPANRKALMWLITPRGFFSAVNDPTKRGTVKVRSRVREDLERLCELDPMRRYARKIEESEFNDYRFRIYVKKRHWRQALSLLGEEITYDNHKDEVKRQQGPQRASIYTGVWWDLLELQEPREWEYPARRGEWADKPDSMIRARSVESLIPEDDLCDDCGRVFCVCGDPDHRRGRLRT